MRISVVVRRLSLLLAIASPAIVFAQFQPPTSEELKMTAEPMAPGAAAVYLNVEEITDDPHHFHSVYERIKVLEEKGKELATVEIPYLNGNFQVTDIMARTIHSDGTVIPLVVKPEDMLTSKSSDQQINRKVFNLPSVEVGSILEYRYQVRYGDNTFSSPFWEFQKAYFVRRSHYSFTPFKGFLPGERNATNQYLVNARGSKLDTLIWDALLPPGIQVKNDVLGRFLIDLTNTPAKPDEEWMPPIGNTLAHVRFYYKNAANGDYFWQEETKRWSKEVNHFAEASKPMREAVAGLIAPGDSELDKAKKIYKAVQALENTDYSRKKGQAELKQLGLQVAKRAEDTWTQKSGTSEDITLLCLAMLRAAGLTANDMKVVNREERTFAPNYLSFDQLDADIIILSIGGKDIVLDPGEKMCPFQMVNWRHAGAGGVRQTSDGHFMAVSPLQPYTANSIQRRGEITLDSHGTITAGTFSILMAGQPALYWRQTALRNDDGEVKKQFDRWLGPITPKGVEAHVDYFSSLDDPDANLMAVVKVKGTLGTSTPRRLFLPEFFFEARGQHPFVDQIQRRKPVDMHYAEQIADQVVYHLPPGMAVEGAPQDTNASWPEHAVLVAKAATAPGQVKITRQLSRAFTLAKPEEYFELRDFYQKIADADQQQLVLTMPPVGQGN